MATIRRRPSNLWKPGSTRHPSGSWPLVLPSTVAVPVLLALLGGCSPDRASAPDDAVEVLDSVGVAAVIPSVQGLTLGPGGELWVRRDPAVAAPGAWRYDVFDDEGRFLGPLSLPERFLLHEVGTDYLLGVRTDELNVPFVELYALERGR